MTPIDLRHYSMARFAIALIIIESKRKKLGVERQLIPQILDGHWHPVHHPNTSELEISFIMKDAQILKLWQSITNAMDELDVPLIMNSTSVS